MLGQTGAAIPTDAGSGEVLVLIVVVATDHVRCQLVFGQACRVTQWVGQRTGIVPQLVRRGHVGLDEARLVVCLGSTLQERHTDVVVLGDGLVVVDQVIEHPCHVLIRIVLGDVVALAVDRLLGIGNTKTIVLQFGTELYAVGQTVERLPDFSEIQLRVGRAVDTEVAALVGGIFQFVDRVLQRVVVSKRSCHHVAVFIVRHCPRNHAPHGAVVAARAGDTGCEVVAIVLVTVRGVHGDAHEEVAQRLDLDRGVHGEALERLSFLNAFLVEVAERAIGLYLIGASADAQRVLTGDAGLLCFAGPVVAAHELGMVDTADPSLVDVLPAC